LVLDLLNIPLLGNILGFNFIGDVGVILSLDFDWVVVCNNLGSGNLNLNSLGFIFHNLLFVWDVFKTRFSLHRSGSCNNLLLVDCRLLINLGLVLDCGSLIGNRGCLVGHWSSLICNWSSLVCNWSSLVCYWGSSNGSGR